MKPKEFYLIPRSLSARLSLWVVLFVAMLFLATFSLMFYYAREAVRNEAEGKAEDLLEKFEITIYNTLQVKKVMARQAHWNVEKSLGNTAETEAYLKELLENEPDIVGVASATDSQMIYYYREGGKLLKGNQFAGESYLSQPWYEETKNSGREYWSEPMENYKTDGEPIISYAIPLHSGDKVVGVFAIDISLYWLSSTIQANSPSPNMFAALATRKGAFLVHPDTTLLKPGAMFKLMEQFPGEKYSYMAYRMLGGETGYSTIDFNGQKSYVAYKPLKGSQWVMDVVCPEEEIMGDYNNLIYLMTLIVVLALIMIAAFLYFFIHRELVPLRTLEASARQMANGDYAAAVTVSGRRDEVGSLNNSFVAMRQSIIKHLAEIDQNRQMLDEQNKALNEALEHAKEADRVKTAFLQNMTDMMSEPTEDIARIVAELGRNVDNLDRMQVKALAESMDSDTRTITTLLDRMLEVATNKEEGGL